jgi:hypothetical protein
MFKNGNLICGSSYLREMREIALSTITAPAVELQDFLQIFRIGLVLIRWATVGAILWAQCARTIAPLKAPLKKELCDAQLPLTRIGRSSFWKLRDAQFPKARCCVHDAHATSGYRVHVPLMTVGPIHKLVGRLETTQEICPGGNRRI